MKTVADYLLNQGRSEGWQEGHQEGRQEGRQEGLSKGRHECAIEMLKLGIAPNVITQVTKLDASELTGLLA